MRYVAWFIHHPLDWLFLFGVGAMLAPIFLELFREWTNRPGTKKAED